MNRGAEKKSKKRVKFGISLGTHPDQVFPPETLFSFAERAEMLGFDSLWMGDHIAFHGPYTESLTTLAAFAARTKRITLGTSVFLLPLRRPAVTAKMAATVDFLSGGRRFILGVGVGGEGKKEFELCGVPVRERGARTDESIQILRKLWSGTRVGHQGRFWRFEETMLNPPPATPGGPPIWIGGRSDAARRRAARLGDGYVTYMFTPDRFRAGLQQIKEWAGQAGRELGIGEGRWTPAHHAFIHLHDDAGTALRQGTENLSRRYNMDFGDIAEKYLFYGPPERCLEKIEAFREAGVAHFILRHAGPAEGEEELMERLAQEVIPKVGG